MAVPGVPANIAVTRLLPCYIVAVMAGMHPITAGLRPPVLGLVAAMPGEPLVILSVEYIPGEFPQLMVAEPLPGIAALHCTGSHRWNGHRNQAQDRQLLDQSSRSLFASLTAVA